MLAAPVPEGGVVSGACVHHWVLPESGRSAFGQGRCKKCHLEREFALVELEDLTWNDRAGTARGAAASAAARKGKRLARQREALA